MPSILVLTSSKTIPAEQLRTLPSLQEVQLSDLTIATGSATLTAADFDGSKFDAAVSTGHAGHHSLGLLGTLASALNPGAKIYIQETAGGEETLKKNLMLSGFTNTASVENGTSVVTAEKPAWETGAKAAITLKPKPAANTWSLTNVDDDDDDDELIEEGDLLTEEDLTRPAPMPGSDCEVGAGGRKACENCTCGRAEGEVRKLTKEMIENPTSGCGSCALGDAFRCAGCPYRGLPAFDMGKKIELPPDFLLADLE